MKKVNQVPVSLGVYCRKHLCFYVDLFWGSKVEPRCPKCKEEK